MAEATALEFVEYVLFSAATVLFKMALRVEVVNMTEVVFENVTDVVDIVEEVVVFETADDVDSDITIVDVVELK